MKKQHVSVQQIMDMLGVEQFAKIERKIREFREAFNAPYLVPDYDAFKRVLTLFYTAYFLHYYGCDLWPFLQKDPSRYRHWQYEAMDWAERLLGGYNAYYEAEKESIRGESSGFIGVVDKLTEALIELHKRAYLKSVFYDLIEPSDYETKLDLAEEYLRVFGRHLFHNSTLMHPGIVAAHLESVIEGHIAAINNALRPRVVA